MIGYKDQTWCSRFNSGHCKNKTCPFALTKEEQIKAIQWWGSEHFPAYFGDRMDNGCGYVTE